MSIFSQSFTNNMLFVMLKQYMNIILDVYLNFGIYLYIFFNTKGKMDQGFVRELKYQLIFADDHLNRYGTMTIIFRHIFLIKFRRISIMLMIR